MVTINDQICELDLGAYDGHVRTLQTLERRLRSVGRACTSSRWKIKKFEFSTVWTGACHSNHNKEGWTRQLNRNGPSGSSHSVQFQWLFDLTLLLTFCKHVCFPVPKLNLWLLVSVRTPDFFTLPESRNFLINTALHVQENGIRYYRSR
jgi:hypothetical protein